MIDRILTNGSKLLTSNFDGLYRVNFDDAYKQYIRTDFTTSVVNGDFTVEAMVSCTKTTGNNVLLVQGETNAQYWWMGINADRIVFNINGSEVFSTTTPLTDGVLRQIAVTRVAGIVTFYVNATALNSYSNANNVATTINPELRIASFGNSGSSYSRASVRHIRAWKRALPASELAGLHDKPINDGVDLLEQYKLNEGSGNTVYGTKGSTGTLSTHNSVLPTWIEDKAKYQKLLVSRAKTTGQRSGLKLSANTISIPDAPALNPTAALSMALWVKPNSVTSIVTYAVKTLQYIIRSNGTLLQVLLYIDGAYRDFAAEANIKINTWQRVGFAWDGTTLKLFANKVEIGSFARTGLLNVTTNPLVLGSNALYGGLECVQMWDKAITLSEYISSQHSYLPADTPNLVEQFPINEGVGTIVYGTKGNNGTISGTATWTTPSLMNWIGKHVRFDTGASVNCGNKMQYTYGVTVECWVKFTASPSLRDVFGRKSNNTGFFLNGGSTGVLSGITYFSSGSTAATTGFTPNLNQWYHMALSVTQTLMTYYVDGNVIQARAGSYNPINNVADFIIGAADMVVDDVRFFNSIRTQTEIQENMNKTIGRHPNLVLNMGFESDYYDASGYGNHGTPIGSSVIEVTDNDKLLLNAPIN